MLISWKRRINCDFFFVERRTITSVTITKNDGGKIARKSSKIRETMRLGP